VDPHQVHAIDRDLGELERLLERGERFGRMTGLGLKDPEILHRRGADHGSLDAVRHRDRAPEVLIRLFRVTSTPVELAEQAERIRELRCVAERLQPRDSTAATRQRLIVATLLEQRKDEP
jgi:hypothetical protein